MPDDAGIDWTKEACPHPFFPFFDAVHDKQVHENDGTHAREQSDMIAADALPTFRLCESFPHSSSLFSLLSCF